MKKENLMQVTHLQNQQRLDHTALERAGVE
jgi:hypothetical protein